MDYTVSTGDNKLSWIDGIIRRIGKFFVQPIAFIRKFI